MSVVGLIGILVFLAGVYLLWQARKEVLYWLGEFFRILRGEVRRRGGLVDSGQSAAAEAHPAAQAPARRQRSHGTLVLLGAFALIVLGQVLFILDLAF